MGFFSDLGDAVSSAASTVGDAVEGTADAVVDTVEDAINTVVDKAQRGLEIGAGWVCKNDGSIGCGAANIIGGAIDGLLKGARDILDDGFDIIRDAAGIVGSILRLDLPGFIKGLGSLFLNLLELGLDGFRFVTGGYIVGGIVKYFKRSMLIGFVERLVGEHFGDDPQRLSTVRQNIGLTGGRFGFHLPAQHRVFVMDSNSVPLWRMHKDGVIDLYAMAGLLSFDSFSLGVAHPNTVIKVVRPDGIDSLAPINRTILSHYINSNGQLWHIRVYSMSRQTVAQMLNTASRKLDEIGVILEWNDGEDFAWFRNYARQEIKDVVLDTDRFSIDKLYNFDTGFLEKLLELEEYNRPPGVNCELLALGGFKLHGVAGKFGKTGARNILECDDFPNDCETPERSDRCCNTISRRESSGVIYRDVYPTDIFQYVLAHEIGHYLGLCHCGHDGFQNVMFTGASLSPLSIGLLSYYWESEPHFSLEDGKNAWRFIVDQMTSCLTGGPEVPEPVPDEPPIVE